MNLKMLIPGGSKVLFLAIFLLMIISLCGCGVAKQTQQVSALAKCDFRISTVEQISLAGVKLDNVRSVNDLNMMDMALIMGGFTSPVFPLSLQLNIEGRNPNAKEAGINRLEWILFIDDIQMASGILEKPILIPALSSTVFPVGIGLDLKQVLSGKSSGAILNFCMNLAGVGNTPTRFKIRLKPFIIIAGTTLSYPGYITVNTTYGSK